MNLTLLILMVLPLFAYVFVELRYGVRAGIKVAVGGAIAIFVYWYLAYGEIDQTLILEVALLILLGGIAMRFNDGRLFKFQPVIVGVVFACYCLIIGIWDQPIFLHWWPMMAKLAPNLSHVAELPTFHGCMVLASNLLIGILFVHAAMIAAAALWAPSWVWLAVRLLIYPAMFVQAGILHVCLRS